MLLPTVDLSPVTTNFPIRQQTLREQAAELRASCVVVDNDVLEGVRVISCLRWQDRSREEVEACSTQDFELSWRVSSQPL